MSEKVIGFLKRNYLLIIAYLIPIIIIAVSFKTYYSEYYSPKQYQEYEKQCELTKNEEICSNKELLKQANDKFIKTDAKSHYFEVTYHYIINYITILAPLIVILQTISKLHCEFSSGFIKNTLTRMSYKDYLKKIYLTSLKSALILPAIIIVTLLISTLMARFNFKTPDWVYDMSVYNVINYKYFFYYIISSCLIVYLLGIFYSNIAISFLNKSKNILLVTVFSYLSYFAYVVFFNIVNAILSNILHNNKLSVYLNIYDYWHIYGENNYLYFIAISLMLAIISWLIIKVIYHNKERTIINVEKENI